MWLYEKIIYPSIRARGSFCVSELVTPGLIFNYKHWEQKIENFQILVHFSRSKGNVKVCEGHAPVKEICY